MPGSECTPITLTRAVTVSSLPHAARCRWAGWAGAAAYQSLRLVDRLGMLRKIEGSVQRGCVCVWGGGSGTRRKWARSRYTGRVEGGARSLARDIRLVGQIVAPSKTTRGMDGKTGSRSRFKFRSIRASRRADGRSGECGERGPYRTGRASRLRRSWCAMRSHVHGRLWRTERSALTGTCVLPVPPRATRTGQSRLGWVGYSARPVAPQRGGGWSMHPAHPSRADGRSVWRLRCVWAGSRVHGCVSARARAWIHY